MLLHCALQGALAELLNEVLLSRRVFQNHIVKLGIDGGGGFLKVSLGIMELDSHCDSRSPPRKKLLTQRTAKDSSVKRQMLVALSEGLPENFENVRQILSLIKLDKVNFVVSCDMKLANILCGLQSHASTHPCSWCNTESKHQRIAETESVFQVFGIIDALRKFKSVVTACFGMVLEDDFSEKIDRFRDSYLAIMNISVTPKVHAVFFHVKQFIEIKRAPLGVFSEQATESMHHNFSSH